MPLHAENPVSLGGALDGFDDSILAASGRQPSARRPRVATDW